LEEAREAASRIRERCNARGGNRQPDSLLFKKGTAQRELVGLNEMVREMIVLLRGERRDTRYD